MIGQDIRELKSGRRELRNFGLLVGGVFIALGLFLMARGKPWYLYCIVPGALLFVAGLLVPKMLKPVYITWMSLAIILGFVLSHVILTLFFFLVVTPVGLLSRLLGKDFLRLKLDRRADSYWIPRAQRKRAPSDYEQQF